MCSDKIRASDDTSITSDSSGQLDGDINGGGSSQSGILLRKSISGLRERDSLNALHYGSKSSPSGWTPGQEFSHIEAYDPLQDILHASEYASERKELKFRQVFRYATCLDWILMIIGAMLAFLGSMLTPWLYYCGGVLLHDLEILDRCNFSSHYAGGKPACNIKSYCGTTLNDVGYQLFMKILYGWIAYISVQFCFNTCFTIAADRQTKAMRAAYFESIVQKDMAWFDLFSDKDFAKEMTEQITHIRLGIGDVIPSFINLVGTVIVILIIVFRCNPIIGVSFLSFIPFSILLVRIGNWAEKKRWFISDKNYTKASLVAKESMVNIKVIKMYEGEHKQAKRFGDALDSTEEHRKSELKWMVLTALCSGSIWLILNIATSVVFWLGQSSSYQNTTMFCSRQDKWGLLSQQKIDLLIEMQMSNNIQGSPGEVLLVYFCLMYILLHAMELTNFFWLMKIAKDNAIAVYFIIDWKSRIDNISREGKTPKRGAVGRLDFNNVTFRYPQRPEENVLDIKKLTIYSGQYVAFSGPVDSGKNTILKLIPRLYDTCSGFIALDAVNLQNYNIQWLRKQIVLISEEPVIFTGTISENIMFGKLNATEEEVIKACQQAELHHVITKLPSGYNTEISGKDFGDRLTRNEKRQLCLARAYLQRSRLILMDNPVKPEDDELEPLILNFIEHFRYTATLILASTNVTALSKRADCIYYMEHGHILEHGNHLQLIQARGKYYSRLEDTMNTSVESRNKFESQLKAYKYSQILQTNRNVNSAATPTTEEGTEEENEPSRTRKSFLTNFMNMFHHKHKSRKQDSNGAKAESGRGLGARGSGEGMGAGSAGGSSPTGSAGATWRTERSAAAEGGGAGQDVRKKSILRHSKHPKYLLQTAGVENRRGSVNNKSHSEGFMHHAFIMMGFQRLNFARPMTNYSTQIQKQRQAFIQGGSEQINGLRLRAHHPDLLGQRISDTAFSDSSRSIEGTQPRVKFSIQGELLESGSHIVKAGPSKWNPFKRKNNTPMKQKGKGGKFTNVAYKTSNSKLAVSTWKSKIIQKPSNTSSRNKLFIPRDSPSVNEALKNMKDNTNPSYLDENVETDNVSVDSEEFDTFLAEYDEGVHSALLSQEKGFWRDLFYIAEHDWSLIIPGVLASVILGASIPYQAWIVGTYFQILGEGFQNKNVHKEEINWLVTYLLITGVITATTAFMQELLFALAGKRMTRRLREKLFKHILQQDISWFDEKAHDIGILTLQLYSDANMVHHILLMFYGISLHAIVNVGVSIALAAVQTRADTFILSVVYIASVPFIITIVYLSSKKELKAMHWDDMVRPAGNFAQEFLANIKTWFSLGAESFFISNHKKILDKEYRFIKISTILTTFVHSIVQTSSWLMYGAFIYFCLKYSERQTHDASHHEGGTRKEIQYPNPFFQPTLVGLIMMYIGPYLQSRSLRIHSHKNITINTDSHIKKTLDMCIFLLRTTELLIFGPYRTGDQIAILTDVEFGKTAAHKLMRILVNKSETDPPSKKFLPPEITRKDDMTGPPPEIGLTNITYYYPGTDQSLQDGHLRKISMTIASSSYVAIVGPPGSGKSTLCNIILRMCNPTAGVLDFNGDDCFDLSPRVTRRIMGFVEYDPSLFDCSILENIRMGRSHRESTRTEVEEATKLCKCHFDILDLYNDYEHLVSSLDKTPANFSLKQRIAYSRALLGKPKVLLIDDATTSLDMKSDHTILQLISNAREGRTLIVFSHKIEPVRDADTIFVLWDGAIVESGSDTFLLHKKGYYYEMHMTQKVLADSLRNSPQQLNTIRYNIQKKTPMGLSPSGSQTTMVSAAAAAAMKNPQQRKSSIAFVRFLDEKVHKLKADKMKVETAIDKEAAELAKEGKQREIRKEKKNQESVSDDGAIAKNQLKTKTAESRPGGSNPTQKKISATWSRRHSRNNSKN